MKKEKFLAVTLSALMTISSVGTAVFAEDGTPVDSEQEDKAIVQVNSEETDIQLLESSGALDNVTIQNFGSENNMNKGEHHAEVMLLTLANVNQTVNSVSAMLYHDDELLSTTTARQKYVGQNRESISMTIITSGDAEISSSWETVMNQTDWYDKKPNKIVININGEEKTFENVAVTDGVEKYGKMEVALEKVAEVNGKQYSSIQKAVDAARNNDMIKLTSDISVKLPEENIANNTRYYYTIINGKTLTIDFDGYTIKWDENYKNTSATNVLFAIYNNADITITGNGTTIGWANGRTIEFWLRSEESSLNYLPSKLTVESGTFNGQQPFYINDNNGSAGGEIIIKGGRIEDIFTTNGHQQTLNVNGYLDFKENKKIVMQGGTLVHDDPRFVNDGNMVPDGYVVSKAKNADGKNEYTVIPENLAVASISAAPQDYDYNHNNQRWNSKFGVDFPSTVKNYYTSFADAYANANEGDTITLTKNAEGDGIVIDKDVTIDLNNYKYTVSGKAVGSVGTETNGFQLLADNVTFKNGTLTTASTVTCKNNEKGEYTDKAGILIQNYANLNLENVTLDGSNLRDTGYALSNCKGNVKIENSKINTNGKTFAFDVDNSRGTNQTVEVVNSEINGFVEISDNDGKEAKLVSAANEYKENGNYVQQGDEFIKAEKRSVEISADKSAVEMGDTVIISVAIKGNDIANVVYDLKYDSTKFEFQSADTATTPNNAAIHEELYKEGTCYNNGDTVAKYTFKALGQTENVTADFGISNTAASTYLESIEAAKVTTVNNEKVSVAINLKEYEIALKVDGDAVSGETINKSYTNNGHTFTAETVSAPFASVSYKVDGGEETDSVLVAERGTHTIEYTITPATGYAKVTGTFTLVIGDPEYEVEVNTSESENRDYVSGKKIVLVYTNTDGLAFNYGNDLMIDVTTRGYKFNNVEEYKHVYAFVTKAIEGADVDAYKENISCVIPSPEKLISLTYSMDLNFDSELTVQDISVAYGVYNGYEKYFENIEYQKNILRADTDGNKVVNGIDANAVVNAVKNKKQ